MINLEAIEGVHVLVHATAGPESKLHIPTTELIQIIAQSGASVIQLRDRDEVPDKVLVDLGVQVMPVIRDYGGILIVNDRIHVAQRIRDRVMGNGQIGVHLGRDDKLLEKGKSVIDDEMILGASANTPAEVEEVKHIKPDYWGTQVFPSLNRPTGQSVGPEGLQQVKNVVVQPVIAIGSVNIRNARSLMQIADGIAVISAVLDADNPGFATRQLAEVVFQSRAKKLQRA